MWLLALQNTIRRKGQSILTILITSLTILTFVLVLSVFLVISEGLSLSSNRLGADIIVLPNKANADAYETLFTADPVNIYMPSDTLSKVSKINGVQELSPQFFTQTLEEGCCSYGKAIRLVGYDEHTDFILKPWFKDQSFNKLKDDEVIIGSKVESFLGNKVAILGEPFKVVGTLYPTGSGMDETIYLNINVAQKLATEIAELENVWKETQPNKLISSILVKTKSGVDPKNVASIINKSGLNVQAVATSETIASIRNQMKTMAIVVFGLWLALLLIASLALIGRFNSLAKQRKKEIGLLRAIGVQKSQIFRLILTEAWIMAGLGGIIGSILGVICGIPVLEMLRKALTLPPSGFSIKLSLISGLIGVLAALFLGFIASVYPALKSANLEPKEAITQGDLN